MPTSEVAAAREVLCLYPRIYFACHTRHVRDPQSGRLLSRHQASVLDHLDEIDPITLNGLARHMGVTASGCRRSPARARAADHSRGTRARRQFGSRSGARRSDGGAIVR